MINFNEIQFFTLKDENFLERQFIAGKTVAECLRTAEEIIKDVKNISLLDLEAKLAEIIQRNNCTPTFHNYKGFPGKVCLSVNKQLVHGVPTDYQLQEGDVVKVDLGATYESAIADAARTFIVGNPREKLHIELVATCKRALDKGIESIQMGRRVGAIGNAISKFVKNSSNFGLIHNYGGHGIELNQPHGQPFVSNKCLPDTGPRFQYGMTLAIEPMLTLTTDTATRTASDGWTVYTNSIGAHFEDTIFISKDKVHIITR